MTWKIPMHSVSMSLLSLIASLSLLSALGLLFSNMTFTMEWELYSLNSSIIEFTLIFDWTSSMFLSFVCLISSLILFYSGEYMSKDKNLDRFLFLILAFVFSMGALICSPNIISILLGWDGLGLVSYVLVIYYQNEKSANAGMLTVLSNRIGDIAILLSIALLSSSGSWNFILWAPLLESQTSLLKILIILAAMTKSAQIPFSAWLPAAMAAPTPVSALVHSSTLVTAGVFLLIRFSPALSEPSSQTALFILSSSTMFMAGLSANFEFDLKKIIALSTLSQLGVMISVLALGFPSLAFFHLLTHALFKALLFMCAGMFIHNVSNHQDIRSMGSLHEALPLSTMNMNLANLALCGAPFMAGFYSKDLILETAFMTNINLFALALYTVATGLTVSYTFRMIYFTLTGAPNLSTSKSISDSAKTMTTPMGPLGLGAIGSGAILSWLLLPEILITCLSPLFKALILSVSTLGALLGYLLNISSTNYTPKSLLFHPNSSFSGSMWFMPFLSSTIPSFFTLTPSSSLQDSLDKGWSEYISGQGAFSILSESSTQLQSLQDSSLKLYMKSFLLWLILSFLMS